MLDGLFYIEQTSFMAASIRAIGGRALYRASHYPVSPSRPGRDVISDLAHHVAEPVRLDHPLGRVMLAVQ